MRVFFAAIGVILLLVAASGSPGSMLAAQNVLPDAPGRDVTVKRCANCHAAETVASVRHTPEGWRDVIAKMVAAGAEGTEQELEILRKEAAALIAHREKNGPCKKLEDLKKIAGLDYKKFEARKERLACM